MMKLSLGTLVLIGACLAQAEPKGLIIPPSIPQGPCPGFVSMAQDISQRYYDSQNHVCFYEGTNFTGRSVCRIPGDVDVNLRSSQTRPMSSGFEDRISSICVRGDDILVKVYEHPMPVAKNATLTTFDSIRDLRNRFHSWKDEDGDMKTKNWDDAISALEVTKSSFACFFENENFGGNYFCLAPRDLIDDLRNVYDSEGRKTTWNDNIRSIYIPENSRVEVLLTIVPGFQSVDTAVKGSVLDIRREVPSLNENLRSGYGPGISSIFVNQRHDPGQLKAKRLNN